MSEKQTFISVTTFGQLFNFFVTLAGVIVAVNCFFDLDYRLNNMTRFEDNIGVVVDLISGIAALSVSYFSIITPYDAIEIVTTADENFRTVLYMICLHMAAQAEIVDDPAIIFSGVFEAVGEFTNGTAVDVGEEISFTQAFEMDLYTGLIKGFLNLIYLSKIWLTIAGVIYSFYVIRAHYPICDTQCRRIFAFTLLGRLPALMATIYALVMYFINYNIDTVERFANELYSETEQLNADLPAVTVFETLGVVALGAKILYILVFWGRYDFSLIGSTFLLGKSIVKADLQLNEDESFDGLVYAFMFLASMTIGPLILNMVTFKIDDYAFFIPKVLYKVGILFMLLSAVFIMSSYTIDWFDFDFKKITIGADIIEKIDGAVAEIDKVQDDLFAIVKKLNPCVRKNPNFEDDIPNDDGLVITPIGTTTQLENNLRDMRQEIWNRDDLSSQCVDQTNNYDFYNPSTLSGTLQGHCQKVIDEEQETRERMQRDGIDDDSGIPDNSYEDEDFDNDKYIENNECKERACNAMTGVATAAMILSIVPFAGKPAMLLNFGQRAAFTVFKVGRKIAKFGPRIKKKKTKFKKLADLIKEAGTNSSGKMKFTAAMSGMYLPAFICIVVALAVIMFRRDIYLSVNNRGSYTALKNDKKRGLQNNFRTLLVVFVPMLIVNAAFTAMLYIVPDFLFKVIDLINDTGILIASGEERPGYTALKMTYLLTTLGSLCVVVSGIVYLIAGSFTYLLTWIKEQVFSVGRRRESKPAEYPNGISKFWYPVYWILDKFLNLNTQYLQPLIFSLPAIYIIFDALVNDKDYFSLNYGAGPDMAELADSLGEGISNRERTEATTQELDNQFCGIVGKMVSSIVDASLVDLTNLLSGFSLKLDIAFEGLGDFLASIESIIDGAFTPFDLPSIGFIGTFLKNMLIYGIPIGCSGTLVVAWVLSQFYIPDKNTLLYLCSGIFIASVANLMIHSAVGNIFQMLADFRVPLFAFELVMGQDYFYTQICSIFNIASVIVTILNYVSPIPQFSLDGLYGDNKNEWVATYDVSPTEPKKETAKVTPEVTPAETEGKYAF